MYYYRCLSPVIFLCVLFFLALLGKAPDKAWKTLRTGKHRSEESFHQYVVRVCREVEVWATLAMTEDSEVDTKYNDIIMIIISSRYLLLHD